MTKRKFCKCNRKGSYFGNNKGGRDYGKSKKITKEFIMKF